jgi:hypothetical protein
MRVWKRRFLFGQPELDVPLERPIRGSEVVGCALQRCVDREHRPGRNVPGKHKCVCGPYAQNVDNRSRQNQADEQQGMKASSVSRAGVLGHGVNLAHRVGTYLCWTQERLQSELWDGGLAVVARVV